MNTKPKRAKKSNNNLKKAMIIFLLCIIIISAIYLSYYYYQKLKAKKDIKEIQEYFTSQEETVNAEKTDKIKQLNETNQDIKGWIQIADTKINYPILQSEDNKYYLTRNYKKEKSKYGSIYLKSGIDINDNNSNLILYGHDMRDGEMFKGLLNYAKKDYYNEHKYVSIITQDEEREYQIIAAFKSRIFYKDEKNVFRFYNHTKFETKDKYNEYIENVNKIKLYDTGITANYGEQLLTMITCEYSQENGRMVVVAKRIK